MIGIYKITSPSNKVYIGQTWNVCSRKSAYKRISPIKQQRKLYASLVKYGWENHKFEVIHEFPNGDTTQDHLDYAECFFMNLLRLQGLKSLNLREGGKSYGKPEKETLIKMKVAQEKRWGKLTNEQKISFTRPMIASIVKPVRQLSLQREIIKDWSSMREASRGLNIYTADISSCCKNKTSHVKVRLNDKVVFFKFEYK